MSEPTFAAANIKLDLPSKFAGKPSNVSSCLFKVELYRDIVRIVKPVDKVRLAVSDLNVMLLLGGVI